MIFGGDVKKAFKSNTTTAKYLKGEKTINYAKNRKQKTWLEIKNANINNISNLNVRIST